MLGSTCLFVLKTLWKWCWIILAFSLSFLVRLPSGLVRGDGVVRLLWCEVTPLFSVWTASQPLKASEFSIVLQIEMVQSFFACAMVCLRAFLAWCNSTLFSFDLLIVYLFVALFLFWIAGRIVLVLWLNQSGLGLSFVMSFDFAICIKDLLKFEYDGIWLLSLLQGVVMENCSVNWSRSSFCCRSRQSILSIVVFFCVRRFLEVRDDLFIFGPDLNLILVLSWSRCGHCGLGTGC